MQLVADRFVVGGDGRARDLATGERVTIVTGAAGTAGEQRRWTAWCDDVARLHHGALARLIDYGLLDSGHRFEAWACGPVWRGSAADARSARLRAQRILAACGLGAEASCVRQGRECAVVVPVWHATDASPRVIAAACPADRAVIAQTRPEERALLDLIRHDIGGSPRVAVVFGPPGSGASTILLSLARAARREGFVPISAALLAPGSSAGLHDLQEQLHARIQGRRLLILDDGSDAALPSLLDATLRTPRPHVLIIASATEREGLPGFPLRPIADETLAASVVPQSGETNGRAAGPDQARSNTDRLLLFARRSHGLPGAFSALVLSPAAARFSRPRERHLIASEPRAVYAADTPPAASRPVVIRWAASAEVTELRARMADAERLIGAGRHAAGERGLRQAMGALARRADWTGAAQASAMLARAALARGRAKTAQALIDEGRAWLERRDDPLLRIDLAVLASAVSLELMRLDEAEALAGAAQTAARASADGERLAAAACALARVAFWRGEYADALECVEAADLAPATGAAACALRVWRSRAAVGLRDVGRAVANAVEAVALARAAAAPELEARALATLGIARMFAGDLPLADENLAQAHRAAHGSRAPVRAMIYRLLRGECQRRAGHPEGLRTALARLHRLAPELAPPRLKAIATALTADISRHPAPRARLALAAERDGALALLRSGDYAAHTMAPARVADEIVEIIATCHDARDEPAVLQELCVTLRRQLRAAAVACFGTEGTALVTLAAAGERVGTQAAERAIVAGIPIVPHRVDERIEAAAPVRYGGATIGAIAGRWTIGAPHAAPRAPLTFATAATAAAPFVSGALARRRQAAASGAATIVGVSPAVGELRRAVERAAAAPFPVLIEGESGVGKELVARALHLEGARRNRAFCSVNCAALPDDLVESELFGHAKGAFTGAAAERSGVFEEAHGGTLFLDEIGELSLRAQAKVLRVIQEGEVRRLGENASRRVDARVVCATNRTLRDEVAAGRFRQDLFYRLDVIRIVVAPLRERPDDIPVLVEHFWREATARLGSRATLAMSTVAALARYEWPGNVRELQNVLAALAVRAGRRGVVQPAALPPQFATAPAAGACRLDEARRTFEERFVRAALVRTGGFRSHAAAELGLTRQGLAKLMARLGIEA